MSRPPPILTPSSPSPATTTSSDTQTMINALIIDILQGEKPKTPQDAIKLHSVLTKLLAHWVSSEIPVGEQAALKAALFLEKELVGCFSSCCLPRIPK